MPNVCPDSWGELDLVITFSVQILFQKLLRKDSALCESIHSLSDFDIDVPIFSDFGGKIVLLDKVVEEVAKFEPHIFVVRHRSVEVEIFDVECHELGTRSGDYTVEEKFYCEEIDGGCATVIWVVYSITTNCETCMVGIIFFQSVVDNNTAVGDIPPDCSGDIGFVDEDDDVCAFNLARHSLC